MIRTKRRDRQQSVSGRVSGSDPLWRRIEQSLRKAIIEGRHAPGSQLPPDRQIASEYGASRVTARRALAALEQDGLLRIEHGNGTFVSDNALVHYRLGGNRVRFNQNFVVVGDVQRLHRCVLGTRETEATSDVARHLGIAPGDPVLELRMSAFADECSISVGLRRCPAKRFRGLAEAFERHGTLTKALREFGVADYRRASTEIIARMPTAEEARLLAQPRLQPVLAYTATDIEIGTGQVISYYTGCFASHRVAITIGDEVGEE